MMGDYSCILKACLKKIKRRCSLFYAWRSGTWCTPLGPDWKTNQDCKSLCHREEGPATKDTVCGQICSCLHIDNECSLCRGQKTMKKTNMYIKKSDIMRGWGCWCCWQRPCTWVAYEEKLFHWSQCRWWALKNTLNPKRFHPWAWNQHP